MNIYAGGARAAFDWDDPELREVLSFVEIDWDAIERADPIEAMPWQAVPRWAFREKGLPVAVLEWYSGEYQLTVGGGFAVFQHKGPKRSPPTDQPRVRIREWAERKIRVTARRMRSGA